MNPAVLDELIDALEDLVRVGKTVGTVGQDNIDFVRRWNKAYERAEKALFEAKK